VVGGHGALRDGEPSSPLEELPKKDDIAFDGVPNQGA